MLEAISLGLVTGIVLSFGFGSVFFALIQSSIDYGYMAGVKISMGVIFGDIIMITIALLGTSFLPDIPHFATISRVFGSLLLVGLGVAQFSNTKPPTSIQEFKLASFFYFFGKGFLLNVINPVNFISWMVVSATLKGYNYDFYDEMAFFATSVLMIFILESAFAIFADKIKDRMNNNTIQRIKYVSGIVFIGIGMKLIYDIF